MERSYIIFQLIMLSVLSGCSEPPDTDPREVRNKTTESVAIIHSDLPDFLQYNNIATRKDAFIKYIYPKIKKINKNLIAKRNFIEKIAFQKIAKNKELSKREKERTLSIALEYKITVTNLKDIKLWRELLLRVDTVPPSIAISQAAMESAWGTSRFAREGNNLFGQWCFNHKCGIVPARRNPDSLHSVAVYKSVDDSIEQYIHNLNTHIAYKRFRDLRYRKRMTKQTSQLHAGLINYSENGLEYVKTIGNIIRQNNLEKFDVIVGAR